MFLFLSKLLPIFLYPVGLSCVLLTIAVVLLWRKRSRLALIPISLTFVVLFWSSSTWASSGLIRSLEFQYLPQGELPKAEAIVVLGGSTTPPLPPRPWIELNEEADRVVYAAKLYRDGKAPRLILSGGRVEWRPNRGSEAEDMATLLELMGVPRSAMRLESNSLNTRENAVNTKQILDAQGIRQILLVTSAMHMPRSMMIFKKLGINAIPAPADFISVYQNPESPSSLEAKVLGFFPDADQLRRTTRAMKEYVGIFIYWLRGWV